MFIFSTQVSSTHYDAEQVGHVPSKAKYIHVWSPESRRIVCKESRPGPKERRAFLSPDWTADELCHRQQLMYVVLLV